MAAHRKLIAETTTLFRQTLARGDRLFLFANGGLFEVLALFHFRQNAGFFARLLETAKCLFETFVVTNSNQCHELSPALQRVALERPGLDVSAETVGGNMKDGRLTIQDKPARPLNSMDFSPIDIGYMKNALKLARQAADLGEVPVGALVVFEGKIVSEAYNLRETERVATHHAELMALEAACRALGRWRLTGCTLYVTLEPCAMCAGAIVNSRPDRVVYGANDSKAGAVESLYQILSDERLNHRPLVTSGVLSEECGQILTDFFRARRR